MGNYEIDNVNEQKKVAEKNADNLWILTTIGLGLTTIVLSVKDFITSRNLKQKKEKDKLYQEALRKHQIEINELKIGKECKAYKDRLQAELQAEIGG